MDLHREEHIDADGGELPNQLAEPIYYLYGEDVKWWDDEIPAARAEPLDEWIHPPRALRLSEAVHRLNDTHIPSPLLYQRFPHEYRSSAFEEYHQMASSDDKGEKPTEEPVLTDRNTEAHPDKHRVNIELTPVKPIVALPRPKKSLRQRLRDGEVVFYEDYIERQLAYDYYRLFGEPFNVPRHDWGGGDFFFGEHVPSDHHKNGPVLDHEGTEQKETAEPDEAPVKHRQVDALILADTTLDPKKREELLNGEIGSIFSKMSSNAVRQRHPKDRLVSYHHLRTYACMIDSVTKCPLIHVELQSALKQGWSPEQESAKMQAKQRPASNVHDPYAVTPEQISRANDILASRRKPKMETSPMVNMLVSRRRGLNKEAIQVGGGRYQV